MFYDCWSGFDVWKWTNYPPMQTLENLGRSAGLFTTRWFAAYERPDRYSWAIEPRPARLQAAYSVCISTIPSASWSGPMS